MTAAEKKIFSVSDLNRQAKQLLEVHLPLIWVSGELSNLSRPASGHWYFTLKDERAQVRCAMFRNANQRLRWQPQVGEQVLLRARVSIYEGRGDYQLIAEHMEQAGTGNLQQAFEALKLKLQSEGLFNEQHKQALPFPPRHIGVITSPSGAAIRDVLSVIERRFAAMPVTVLPVAVQGNAAAQEIIRALEIAERYQEFDLLIITRGGGSIEDLWPFNDETLARKIHTCPIPIISAVGHEIDFTICDFVADLRAATPSASAEIATPDTQEWLQQLDGLQSRLERSASHLLQQLRLRLHGLSRRLKHPREKLESQKALSKNRLTLLQTLCRSQLTQHQSQLQQLQHRLAQCNPQKTLNEQRAMLLNRAKQLSQLSKNNLQAKQNRHQQLVGLLDAVSPLKVIDRGFAVVTDSEGKLLKDVDQLEIGKEVNTKLSSGEFTSQVVTIKPCHKKPV